MSVQIYVGFDAAGLAGDAMVSGVGCHVDVGPDVRVDVEIGNLGDLSRDSVGEGRGGLRVGDGVVAASGGCDCGVCGVCDGGTSRGRRGTMESCMSYVDVSH